MSRASTVGRLGVIFVVIAVGVFGALAGRSLFADGSYFLWVFLDTGGPLIFPDRVMVEGLTQLPLAVAIWFGVSDIHFLVLAQGLGLIVLVTLVWALALFALLRHRLFWVFVAIFAVIYLNGGLMSIGEFNLTYALVALSGALLLRTDRRPWHALTLLASGVLLLRAFESMVFLGPLLVVFVVVVLREGAQSRWWRATLGTLVGLYSVATVLSAWAILFPRDPANRNNAANLLGALSSNFQLVISGAAALALMVVLIVARGRWVRPALVTVAVLPLLMLIPHVWARPGQHYEARVLLGLLLFALLALAAIVDRALRARDESMPPLTALVALSLLVALLVPFTFHTVGYARWLTTFSNVLADGNGEIFIPDTELAEGSEYYAWAWTHPYLSSLLRPEGSDAVVQP